MRIAALADVHGNADALAAVLVDLAGQGAEAVLLLGDHFSGPLDAAGTWEQVRGLDALALRGNHDRYLLEVPRAAMGASDAAASDTLPEGALGWLAALPATLRLEGVLACHGTPASDETYLCERVTLDGAVVQRDALTIALSGRGRGRSDPLRVFAPAARPAAARRAAGGEPRQRRLSGLSR